MPDRKVYLELKSSDYNVNKFQINVRHLDIKQPKSLTIVNSTVKLPSDTDYVKIRSEALTNMRKNQLAGSNNGFKNIIYTLVPDHRIVRSASSTNSETTGVSDSLISNIANLLFWWDFHPSRVLDSNYAEVSTIGDACNYYYNRSPAPASLLFVNQYGTGLQLANVGSTKGVTRNGSWQSVADSVQDNPLVLEEFSFHCLITAPSSLSVTSQLIALTSSGTNIFTVLLSNGAVKYYDYVGQLVATNLSFVPTRSYILSVKRQVGISDLTGNGQNDDYQFDWAIKDLSNNVIQTDLTTRGWVLPPTNAIHWRLGRANYHFEHVQSCVVMFNGVDSTENTNSVAWLEAQYTGNVEVTNQIVTQTNTYQLFSKHNEKLECKNSVTPLSIIDLQFENSSGVICSTDKWYF
jgi:hypothetical protein